MMDAGVAWLFHKLTEVAAADAAMRQLKRPRKAK